MANLTPEQLRDYILQAHAMAGLQNPLPADARACRVEGLLKKAIRSDDSMRRVLGYGVSKVGRDFRSGAGSLVKPKQSGK